MKKLIVGLCIAALSFCGASAFAAEDAASNVAVVEIAKVLKESPQVKKATNEMKKKFAPKQAKIEAAQKSLQKQMEEASKNASVMSKADKDKLGEKIAADRKALMADITAFQDEVSKAQADAMKKIFDALNMTIQSVAKKHGYNVVLDSQFVVYAAASHDITADVAAAFDASEKK